MIINIIITYNQIDKISKFFQPSKQPLKVRQGGGRAGHFWFHFKGLPQCHYSSQCLLDNSSKLLCPPHIQVHQLIKCTSVTPLLSKLHWLLIAQRIEYTVSVIFHVLVSYSTSLVQLFIILTLALTHHVIISQLRSNKVILLLLSYLSVILILLKSVIVIIELSWALHPIHISLTHWHLLTLLYQPSRSLRSAADTITSTSDSHSFRVPMMKKKPRGLCFARFRMLALAPGTKSRTPCAILLQIQSLSFKVNLKTALCHSAYPSGIYISNSSAMCGGWGCGQITFL